MIRNTTLAAVGLLILASGAAAQTPERQPGVDRQVNLKILRSDQSPGAPLPLGGGQIEFLSIPVDVVDEPVSGAPYSAEAVTEVVQSLADGNRIVRESRTAMYRDGAGRTRREYGLAMIGGLVGGPDGAQQVQISDPRTGVSYHLDVANRVARKLHAPAAGLFVGTAPEPGAGEFNVALPPPASGAHDVVFFRSTRSAASNQPAVESLGRQSMEGVEVEGTRSTITIPAGQIGNEQPIRIVSERWYSPALKVLVLSRQSDPRFGETTYRLTGLVRTEPPPDLFEIPSDFTVAEPGPAGAGLRIETR
jgi:hypothetical protein